MKTKTTSETTTTTTKTRTKAARSKTAGAKTSTRKRSAKKPARKAVAEEACAASAAPNHDEIAQVAYAIYQDRIASGIPGDAISDWQAAEATILEGAELAVAV